MRKQGYAIIGIGLAALAGVFWLAQLNKQEKTPTAAKPPTSSQETTVASPTEEPIDHFAAMRRQSSEIEHLSEEDKALAAKRQTDREREVAYENSPRGNYLETYRDKLEDGSGFEKERISKRIVEYNALDTQGKAVADLGDWISRQLKRRVGENVRVMFEEVIRTGNINLLRFQDIPENTATVAEAKAMKAISKIQTGWETEPEPWQEVAAFLRDRRNFSLTELNQGDPVDPNWHADHIEWIEQIAQTIGIPLDNPEDESWLEEKIAAAKEQRYQDLDAPLIEELKKIDEETAAAAEAWAREPDSKEKEAAQKFNQTIKGQKQWRAQREHERRYREEMKRNPVFKEMERERQRKERVKARQAQEQAEQPPASKAE